jgi:transcription-repair coupling factor (superfamily II helicase)
MLLAQLSQHQNLLTSLATLGTARETLVLGPCHAASHAYLLTALCRLHPKKTLWVIHESPRLRERIAAEMECWGQSSLTLPEPAADLVDGTIADPEAEAERMQVFEILSQGQRAVIHTHSSALSAAAPEPLSLQKARLVLEKNARLDPQQFTDSLTTCGYERSSLVHTRGQFAIRGGIIDLFPWHAAMPLRLEFFDQELESIREYDPDSQLSTTKRDRVTLSLHEPDKSACARDYIRPEHWVIHIGDISDPTLPAHLQLCEHWLDDDSPHKIPLEILPSPLGVFEAGDFILQQQKRERFFSQIEEWRRDHWTLAMSFANRGEEERFQELAGDFTPLPVLRGELQAGFLVPAWKMAVLSSSELFGRYRTGVSVRKSLLERNHAVAANLEEIQIADLVVHYEYGIGRFRGIQISDDGHTEEMIIEYQNGALLEVPIDQAHLVAKYVGMGGKTPELHNLGGSSWKNTRKTAEKSILDYAAQILRVQAERQTAEGYAHPPDSRWMWEFENSFHFTETVDQRRAIEETKRDMESSEPMDRLICGDVGFGKTEVAIRAAFKTVTGGKQVAILVPTTVLAEQHWRTFRERMSDYPIRVDLLNRFRTPAEVRETIAGVADGSVDIVIGTHRLLSGDVTYHNLGLVVIDEEQRFGVKHKEKFKEIFRHIDILTLSATPIPRTLYMALMGTRDMSTIDTPPPNRTPVHTTISPYDERIIRDAILREMHRGGQVFFLHNRVKTIDHMRTKLQTLVPEARILIGHGQMEQDELEVVMKTFVKGEADILLATTIIETGIDIPNANTILIDRADRFGLADLYQLRGRVGRAGEQAYAILLLPRDMIAQGDARKRIQAIREYTALGSGFKIAMRDLEIRGAGNLLGTKQSGHIAAVGFDLYCKLLRQSVDRLKGRASPQRAETTLKLDCVALTETEYRRGDAFPAPSPKPQKSKIKNPISSIVNPSNIIPAYLSTDFIDDTKIRVHAYRELAECLTEKELDALETSWRDRFGRFPAAVTHLFTLSRIKIRAAGKKISLVELKEQRLTLIRNNQPITVDNRHPRLKSTKPEEKLTEILELLRVL